MANSDPAWIRGVSLVVTVNNIPVTPDENTEVAAGDVGRYSGVATSYQAVAGWTVSTGNLGKLVEVSLKSNNYSKTLWKLIIGDDTFMQDVTIGGALTLPFNEAFISAGKAIALYAKSSDGTAITADGSIVGKEVG